MKRNKKRIIAVSALVLLLISVLPLGAIAACNHSNYTWDDVLPDTCGEWIMRVYTCHDCGETWEDGLIILDHDYEWTVITEPTCTIKGMKAEQCVHCGDILQSSEIPAGHEYTEYYVAPTCITVGYSCGKCIRCGVIDKSYGYTEVPKLNYHTYENGKCIYCGVANACIEHKWNYVYSNSAHHIFRCSVCNVEKNDNKAHIWTNKTLVGYGYEGIGKYQYTCELCPMTTIREELIPCIEHTYTWTVVNGDYHVKECLSCGQIEGDVQPHSWDGGIFTQLPSSGAEGSREFTCSVCYHTKTEVFAKFETSDFLDSITSKQALEIVKSIFFYQAEDDYGLFQTILMEDMDLTYWYTCTFVYDVYPDLIENGARSKYYDDFSELYYRLLDKSSEASQDYQRGYNDAMSSVVNENPIQGLFQALWSSVVLTFLTVAEGVGVGGITVMSVVSTAVVVLVIVFVFKKLGK